MSLKLITPPEDTPVSLEEMKEDLGLSATDSDGIVRRLLFEATDVLEKYLNRAFIPQVWDLTYDSWPAGDIQIPLAPLISVDEVGYVDADTAIEATFASSNYEIDATQEPGWLVMGTDVELPDLFETFNAVRIRFTAGYPLLGSEGSPATPGVPAAITRGIRALVYDWFENRGASAGGDPVLPASVRAMVAGYRVYL